MIKKIDELGRVVLPEEYRQALQLKDDGEVEISLRLMEIIIKKPVWGCVFCGGAVELVRSGDLCACRSCIQRLSKAKDNQVIYPLGR